MPDPNPVTPDPAPANPASTPGTTSGTTHQPPDGFVEKARLDGALQKIQELTLANRSLADQLAAKDQAIGSLQAQQRQKETELGAQVGEHSKKVENLTSENASLKSQIAKYVALAAKVKAINELQRPELFAILDTIPDAPDETVLKANLAKLAGFADSIKKTREAELLAGTTHVDAAPGPAGGGQVTGPADAKSWMAHIESLPFGSPERDKAWQDYYAFTMKPKS